MTSLATIRLSAIHCHDEGDGPGKAAPYLWTIFFKVDGTTATLNVDLENFTVNLIGQASVITSNVNNNHGNLGLSESSGQVIDAGKNVHIPGTLGEWVTIIRSIPIILPPLPPGVPTENIPTAIDGVAGYLAVLLEEDNTTSEDIAVAHKIFNDEISGWINENLSTLSVDLLPFLNGADPNDVDLGTLIGDIDVTGLVNSLTQSIESAIKESVVPRIIALVTAGFLADPLFHLVAIAVANQDDFIGFTHGIFQESDLLAAPTIIAHWNEGTGSEDGDWKLFGKAFAEDYDISSLRRNLTYAGVDPQQGARQVLPDGGHILQWIGSLA